MPSTLPPRQALHIFSARDLRNRSGDLLRDAESGNLSVVTKHGRPSFLALPFDERLLNLGIHRALAVSLFESGQLTLGQSARLAELPLDEMIELLGGLDIPVVDYPPEELEAELEAAL